MNPSPPESGSGQLSTTFGVGVFLTLLLFASHLLLDLWLTSAVLGVSRDAAVAVATSDGTDAQRSQARAIDVARTALGSMGDRVEFRFEADPTGRAVILQVRVDEITYLPPIADDVVGIHGLHRRIVVPIEAAAP